MPNPYRFLALLLLFAFGASLVSFVWTTGQSRQEVASAPELLPAAYANPVDETFADTLHAGETISQLLLRAQLAETEAQALLGELAQYQDPRRMRPGSVIAFRRSINDGAVRKMEFQLDADRTLNLLRDGDAWVGAVEEVPIRVDTVVLTGVIESSLYRALMNGEGYSVPVEERERLVDQLADRIFAWQIDFSRDLRSGDQFRILYERLVRPDGSARSGRVLGAQFNVNSRDYEAHVFAADDASDDYYDRQGESLRRAFLRAPLQYRRISSAFTRSRFHPILQVNRPHNGIDYAAAAGTPVFALGDGTISRASGGGDLGNVIDINHGRGHLTRYAHLQRFAPGIRSGVRVKQGDVIGYVGSTGLATGPHLHFEFHQNGRPVDPNSIRHITGDPVPRSYTAQFLARVQEHVGLLNRSSVPVLASDGAQPRSSPVGD